MKKITLLVCLVSFLSFLVWADQNENVEEKGQVLTDHRLAANLTGNDGKTFTTLWKNDFDVKAADWTIRGLWSIGQPSQNQTRQSSAVAATNLDGLYTDNADAWLISPQVTVGPNVELRLRFRECYKTESYYDYGRVMVSQDNGQTWTAVDSRCGYSDWRETSIYLSHYADSQLRIAFNFQSDASFASSGWVIDDVALEYATRDPLTATMTSLSSQNFPFIYSNINVEVGGNVILGQSNFQAFENGVLQTQWFQVVPPETGAAQRLADIVFCVDVTGSMSSEIASVKNNMLNFINALGASSINYNVGFITFGDIYYVYNSHQLYTNLSQIISITNGITLGEHGIGNGGDNPENQLGAMAEAALFNFRPGAQRVIIMLTDAPSHQNDYVTSWTVTTLINNRLLPNAITVFPIFDTNDPSQIAQYVPIANATNPNGTYFNIYSNFNTILNEIGNYIGNTYIVRYYSSDPVMNGVLRNVDIVVSYQGEQATASGSYMPGAAPQIVRTPATINLHNQSWAAGTQFTIAAQITDAMAPFVQSSRVYYKGTSQTTFQYVQMTQGAANIWSGVIPSAAVQTPGLDYYITATDGQTTSSAPIYQPNINPFQISILPNVAPLITHTPVPTYLINQPVTINANVVDTTNSLTSVKIIYKNTGTLNDSETPMTAIGGSNYTATIPASFATADGIDYYIHAVDNFNVHSDHPQDNYHHMTASVTALVLKEYDSAQDPIANKPFEVYWVDSNNIINEQHRGTLTTDSNGRIAIPFSWFNQGDLIKVSKLLHTQNAVKANHGDVDNIMYTVSLDNAEISNSGNVSYTTIVTGVEQTVFLKHTSVAFNLTISIEWDATQAYIDSLTTGIRMMSNYLYDVFDGQMYINKIRIYDNWGHWNDCDVRIYANNIQGAQANAGDGGNTRFTGGIRKSSSNATLDLPRIPYIAHDDQMELTYSLYPYNWSIQSIPGWPSYEYTAFRTFAHELGHYCLGLLDEYENSTGTYIFPPRNTTDGTYHFGMMDDQGAIAPQNSEISCTPIQYDTSFDPTHRITEHWVNRGNRSCWDYFEWTFEDTYNGVFCPIIRPDERTPGNQMFSGPNNLITSPSYNVGSQMVITHSGSDGRDELINWGTLYPGWVTYDNAPVMLTRLIPWKFIYQGKTDSQERIYVLGVDPGDEVSVMEFPFVATTTIGPDGKYQLSESIILDNHNAIVQIQPTGVNQVLLKVEFESDQTAAPVLIIANSTGVIYQEPLQQTSNRLYTKSFAQSYLGDYTALFLEITDSGVGAYNMYQEIVVRDITDSAREAFSEDGNLEIMYGITDSQLIDTVLISYHLFPVIRTGLSIDAEQAGNCYSIRTDPALDYLTDTYIKLHYSDSDLTYQSETSLKMHRWNDTSSEWELIGGDVNTDDNIVFCYITQPGVYAAFTTINDPSLPVELGSFSATISGQNNVMLSWVSQSETQMLGYQVYRNISEDQSTSSLVNSSLIPATNTSTVQIYSLTDEEVEVGQTYYYWLEALDYASSSYYGPVSVTVNGDTPPVLPEVTELKGAYPNPFRALTNIEVALKAGESGEITIYNIHGQAVRKFEVNQGWHKLIWDGKDSRGQSCGSGVYFYKLSTPSLNQTKKMIMVK